MNDDWKKLIPGAFGCEDLKFSLHSFDQERACEMLFEAIRNQISFSEYCETLERWLRSEASKRGYKRDLLESHVQEQLSRARSLESYFTRD